MRRRTDDTTGAAVHHQYMSTDRRAVRNILMALGAVMVLAVATAVSVAVAGGHDVEEPSPHDAVRDFLVVSVVDGDGVDACGYLTPRAGRSLSAVEPRDMTCHEALTGTRLTLGGERVDTEAEVEHLAYRVTEHGDRARVTVSAHGAAKTFLLVRANAAERAEAGAPATPWRIDSGVDRLAG